VSLGIGTILPRVSTNLLSGFIQALAISPYGGKADLPIIASTLHMEVNDLFPLAETLQMLRFAMVEGGDIRCRKLELNLLPRRPTRASASSPVISSPMFLSPLTSAAFSMSARPT
jgi:hypothetical protein